MKAETLVRIRVDGLDLERIERELIPHLPPGRLTDGVYEVRLRRGDSELGELLSTLDRLGLEHQCLEERTFRPRELAEAPALHLTPIEHQEVTSSRGAFQGSCGDCGRGGEQIDDLVLNPTLPSAPGLTLTSEGQILVDESLATALIKDRISGCLLRRTRDSSGRIQPLFQVLPTHAMPPVRVPPTRLEHHPDSGCRRCGRGSLALASLLYFDVEESSLADLNLCREVRETAGPSSGFVVSQRLFRLLLDHARIPATVEPVVLV